MRELKNDFLDTCNISYIDLSGEGKNWISVGGTISNWGDTSEKQLLLQMQLKDCYKKLNDNLVMIKHRIPSNMFNDVNKASKLIEKWINKEGYPPGLSAKLSKVRFDEELNIIEKFIEQLKSKEKEIVFIPDTNAIIKYPNPADYIKLCPNEHFVFLILPTVLSELDNHKNFHKNPDFQKKVTSVIRRLKGYIKQGDIFQGVKIEKGKVTIKMIGTDPKFDFLPDWLNEKNNDDKIIASILDFQISNLNSIVFLITGDINMLNKANLAGLNYYDNDELK